MDKPVGLTKSAGFQIGVRRTLPITPEKAWQLILSQEGLQIWLGDLSSLPLQKGEKYRTREGVSGEMRVVKPKEQLRMTLQNENWTRPSTCQIRLIPTSSGKTTISFHQENLNSAAEREEMKLHWEEVLQRFTEISTVLGG
ncbi:SRPBCC domain-containing protein [Paenibacillus sp. GP183]|jgi:uncharacterized protein YndB with AHSA1/START domain|uniref:SRPBCC family protein n=1 Tax=Paenibacillus sp. GP183 TaxID=1882751 RepID=UPI00089D4329|nr:SRPBCC domain-containing protein [Paenibacillus sp. GP183]SEB54330.1 Activator of Hsp90 ATPase homolog 1-like protein [Paenibacillus sp. GP183]